MACGGFTCSKNALAALNVLYLLVAFILIGVATYGKAVAIIASISVMGGIVACGVFLLFVAIIGLVGAIKHHQVLLFFYMIILFIIFIIQFAVACACLAINEEKQKDIAKKSWTKSADNLKHTVQNLFNCCGFFREDQGILSESNPLGHPACYGDVSKEYCPDDSTAVCCIGHPNTTSLPTTANLNVTSENGTAEGNQSCLAPACYSIMQKHMNQAVKTTGGIGLFFSFTEIFGVWITVKYRNQKDPKANPSAFL